MTELEFAWNATVNSILSARSEPHMPEATDLPVLILTGLLGSGKTTIFRQLLSGDHELRIAVIVNDVASINIDGLFLAESGVEQIELTNGCMCCSLSDDLEAELNQITEARTFDAIVIEASGASDPVSVANAIRNVNGCRIDGIIAVADAEQICRQIHDNNMGHLAKRQLQTSHLVLLSKTDYVDADKLAQATKQIAEVAPGRMVLPCEVGRIDPQILLSAAMRGAAFEPELETHTVGLATQVIEPAGPWKVADLQDWLMSDNLALLRIKGWFLGCDNETYELQLVGSRWTITEVATQTYEHALAIIGRDSEALSSAISDLQKLTSS